eukprot:m.45911 g.45911  ORF g.45911 m.45911 type:complete len:83 (+) comp5903_c0_seq1:158-406(+)
MASILALFSRAMHADSLSCSLEAAAPTVGENACVVLVLWQQKLALTSIVTGGSSRDSLTAANYIGWWCGPIMCLSKTAGLSL